MTATEFPRTAALAWLAALAALAVVIGWETDWGRQVSPIHEVPVARAQPVTVALLPEYALAVGAPPRRDTVERPVFVPTRRPAPPPAAQEPPKPKIQRGQFVLTGTAVVDKESIAFLREASTGKSRTVRKGDSVNGLTVASIAPDSVVLALGDETEPLALKVAAGPRQTIQPAAAVPAPPQPAPGTTPVPVPGQPAPADAAAPPAQPGQSPEAQSLLERRRAARAAQAAAEASASGAAAGQPPAPPVDPGWADVYRRMQQPRR
jgi:general secretion pathway protein N